MANRESGTHSPGSLLRAWRLERGYRQADLALLLGTHGPEISAIENDRLVPGLRRAVRIQEVTGIEPSVWVRKETAA